MVPAQPPLPTAWNLPFQPANGIHTSILMSESVDGLIVAATRQNAGRGVNVVTGPAALGGLNAPAPTRCAAVTVV